MTLAYNECRSIITATTIWQDSREESYSFHPYSLTIFEGLLYVPDYSHERINVFTANGRFLQALDVRIGHYGDAPFSSITSPSTIMATAGETVTLPLDLRDDKNNAIDSTSQILPASQPTQRVSST